MKAFPYFGSKLSLLDHILPILPEHEHYVEPFGGSGAVLLNKPPSKIETYNDLDLDVVTFFRVLRQNPQELARQIEFTPYAREEYNLAKVPGDVSDIERARLFYIRIRQGFNATTLTYTGWRREKTASRGTSTPETWANSVPHVLDIVDRLKRVQIENLPAADLIKQLDSPSTLFYLDPPYVLQTRNYKKAYAYEMSNHQHKLLLKLITSLKGKVILSGYSHEIYEEMLSGWIRIDIPVRINSSKAHRTERLWVNFHPPLQQLSLGLEALE